MDWFELGIRVVPALVVLGCAAVVVRGSWLLVASSFWPVTTATVTDVRTQVHGMGQQRSVQHHAVVEFQTRTGHERRASVPYFSFLGMTPALGGSLSVRYDPKDRGRAVMDRLATRGLPEIVLGLPIGAVGLYVLSVATQSTPF